jgi:hypothetical protein
MVAANSQNCHESARYESLAVLPQRPPAARFRAQNDSDMTARSQLDNNQGPHDFKVTGEAIPRLFWRHG